MRAFDSYGGLLKFMARSQVIRATLVLLALNAVLLVFQPLAKVPPQTLPSSHTWEWWRTNSFLSERSAPDVVLMGSSLVMIPLALVDADYLDKDIDAAVHSHCTYLEHGLERAGLAKASCFNFALPGDMVSDDYMTERALLCSERKPKVLVIGLTLRDFIDSHCRCAAATTAFRYFERFTPVDDLVTIAMPEFWQRFEYLTGKYLYLAGRKLDLQVMVNARIAALLAPLVAANCSPSPLDKLPTSNNVAAKLNRPEMQVFVIKPHEPWLFENNADEYRKRFGKGNKKLFDCQTAFLNRLLAMAQKERMQVLVVNMPLTPANMLLMPGGYYDRYLAVTSAACTEYGARFVDLNTGGRFVASDFKDTAHMNAAGGKKLLDTITAELASSEKFKTALNPARPHKRIANSGVTF